MSGRQTQTIEKNLNKSTQTVQFNIESSRLKSTNVSNSKISREQVDLELSEGDLKKFKHLQY